VYFYATTLDADGTPHRTAIAAAHIVDVTDGGTRRAAVTLTDGRTLTVRSDWCAVVRAWHAAAASDDVRNLMDDDASEAPAAAAEADTLREYIHSYTLAFLNAEVARQYARPRPPTPRQLRDLYDRVNRDRTRAGLDPLSYEDE
jgi:hypothetical protein